MKPLFWKRVFTVEAVASFSHVWFFDPDLRFHPFALPAVLALMRAAAAAIAQPAVEPAQPGGRSTDISFLRAEQLPYSQSCAASTAPVVEVTTPHTGQGSPVRQLMPAELGR